MTDSTPSASGAATETRPSYAPGTPLWIDLGTPDLPASISFYGQLFGWQGEDMGESFGHYTMMSQDGKPVAAIAPLMSPQQPTAWSTYISTTNAAETAKKVTEAGGQVIAPPMQVADSGTMAVFLDPTGGAFGVWQSDKFNGAELVNTPNSLTWNELSTRDLPAAKAFYTKVFPWTAHSNPMPDGSEYVEWQIDGKSIGGAMAMNAQIPAQVPPHWLVYFAVANTDNTVKRAQELGAKLMMPAMDIPQGRFAVITDPQGATFAVIQLK
ncbi:MAG TPA: VOC family protein [Chloroflexota bacterium]|nr:VOC family protein [Chloroflexota bacterium]